MTFLSPWFLIGALSLAVPIFVHLVRREQARRTPFPSLMFLRLLPQKSTRRRRLHHVVLLALRSLALLLLALAFARPFISSPVKDGPGEPGRNIVILLDSSYSMQYGNRFDEARKQARALITSARPNDKVALVIFSKGAEVVHPLSRDHQAFNAQLDQLRPGANATDFIQALRVAQGLLGGTAGERNEVVLISDFQAFGWNKSTEPISLGAELMPIDVAEGESSNLACVEVAVDPIVSTSKYQGKLRAKLTNFSNQPEVARVSLKVNERQLRETMIRLDARASQVVEFTGFPLLDGTNRVTIEVEGDPLPIDNRFFLTIKKAESPAVLCLERLPGESFYLQQALAVSRHHAYSLTVKPATRARPGDLENVKVVILNDVTRLEGTVVTRLKAWVEHGGGLMIVAGPHVDPGGFNHTFGLLSPAKLETRSTLRNGGFELLSSFDTTHPIFRSLVETRSGSLSRMRFYGYCRVTPQPSATVLARFSNGDPALMERPLGAGKVLLFTSSFDTSWNDMPLSPMYLPLVHQMLHELHMVETRGWVRPGETVQVPIAEGDAPVPIDSPNGKRLTVNHGLSQDGTLFTAEEIGFYRLRSSDGDTYVAVNLDFRESDLRKLKVEDFVAAFGGGDHRDARAAEVERLSPNIEAQEPGRGLWFPFLLAALGFFVLEAIWAARLRAVTWSR